MHLLNHLQPSNWVLHQFPMNQTIRQRQNCNNANQVSIQGKAQTQPISYPFQCSHHSGQYSGDHPKLSQAAESSCKVQEAPSYTFYSNQAEVQVKQEQGTESQTYVESMEMLMQRRAISITLKQNPTEQDLQELADYRRHRLTNYLLKKQKRSFNKKILYQTRKIVADRRIRFKGRFINDVQAHQLLGIVGQTYTFEQLNEMIKRLKHFKHPE